VSETKSFSLVKHLDLGRHSETRFKVSLVFLIAALLITAFIFIFTMIGIQNSEIAMRNLSTPAANVTQANANFSTKSTLENSDLNFTLEMPAQLGQWLYKTGKVQSPTDDTLSDRYTSIYIPKSRELVSRNFDDLTQLILTVREFTADEWNSLEKGCKKGNQLYCEAAGTKVDETNDAVWVYIKADNCPKSLEAKCSLADKIIQSFKLK